MKRHSTLALALLLALALPLPAADTLRMETVSASVKVEGTSTMHDWTVGGRTIEGSVEVPVALAGGQASEWIGKVQPSTRITIPVASLASEHRKMTTLMHDALQAKKSPNIQYELGQVISQKAAGGAIQLETRGSLTIAGTTRQVAMPVTVRRSPSGQLVISGSTPVRMSEYGIKPPTAMLGTIKTGDDVTVSFEWTVGR